MSKKTVYTVVYTDDRTQWEATEACNVGNAYHFMRGRLYAARAMDLIKNHDEPNAPAVYMDTLNAARCMYAAGKSERVAGLFDAACYLFDCIGKDNAVYWPFVANRLLDFLEPEHINMEV